MSTVLKNTNRIISVKVTERLRNADKTLFSFEILPPLKGQSIQALFDSIDPLMEFKPSFIDVTYHREEFIYQNRGNGLLEKVLIRRRPGTVGICAAIMNKYHVDTVPHIICGGFSKEETENALIDLNFLGIENVLVLRGDALKSDSTFVPHEGGYRYASELMEHVSHLRKGKYMHESMNTHTPLDFCAGVAAYPEKHFEAPNLDTDLQYLKEKVDKGADYIVTQMFFDNAKFFEFVDRCRSIGIQVPIIPGLKPLTTKKQLTILPSIFHIDIPQPLVEAVQQCKSDAQVREVGIEWGIQQSKELIAAQAPCLHYYSMGKSTAVREIASALF